MGSARRPRIAPHGIGAASLSAEPLASAIDVDVDAPAELDPGQAIGLPPIAPNCAGIEVVSPSEFGLVLVAF